MAEEKKPAAKKPAAISDAVWDAHSSAGVRFTVEDAAGNVRDAGEHTFRFEVDDGAWLRIDGEIVVERASTAQDLGPKLNRTAADVVRFLLTNGEMVTATQSLTDEMIELFAADIGADACVRDGL